MSDFYHLVFQALPAPPGSLPDLRVLCAEYGGEPSTVSAYPAEGGMPPDIVSAVWKGPGGRAREIFSYGAMDGDVGWHRTLRPGPRGLLGYLELVNDYPEEGPLSSPVIFIVEGEEAYHYARSALAAPEVCPVTWLALCGGLRWTQWFDLYGFDRLALCVDPGGGGKLALDGLTDCLRRVAGSQWPKVRREASVGGLGRMIDDFNSGRSKLLGKGR